MNHRRGITKPEIVWMVIVTIVVLGFMMFCAGATWPAESVWRLLSGWLTYPFKTAGQITIEWTSIGICGGALVLFSLGLHSLLKWLHGLRQTESDWPLKSSLKIVAMILFAFVAGTSMIGIVHQITWMATSEESLIESTSEAWQRVTSQNNLKQFGLAFHYYHELYETLPAGATYSSTGETLHSWQTLLLPYVEQNPLYEKIDLTRPWDDAVNRDNFHVRLEIYLNPKITRGWKNSDQPQPALSHYAGNILVLNPGHGMTFNEIKDGTANTFLAGEVNSNFKAWGDPSNLRDPKLGINRHPDGFGSPFRGGGQMLMSDGSSQFISNDIDPKIFRAHGTPDGGEEITNDKD